MEPGTEGKGPYDPAPHSPWFGPARDHDFCGDALLSLVTSNRTQGNGSKLPQGKFRFDIRKTFLTERVVSHWNRLCRAVVTAPNLSEFKKHLNNALSHMVWF